MSYNPNLFAKTRIAPTGTFTEVDAAPVRPGALDAYRIPSLVDGKAVARKRPVLMAASPTPVEARKGGTIR